MEIVISLKTLADIANKTPTKIYFAAHSIATSFLIMAAVAINLIFNRDQL